MKFSTWQVLRSLHGSLVSIQSKQVETRHKVDLVSGNVYVRGILQSLEAYISITNPFLMYTFPN